MTSTGPESFCPESEGETAGSVAHEGHGKCLQPQGLHLPSPGGLGHLPADCARRTAAPKDAEIQIPGTCDYVTLQRGIKVADVIMVASYLTQDRKVILCYLGRLRVIIKLNKSRKWRPVSGGDREHRSGSQWEGRKRTYAPSLEAEGGRGPWAKESGGLEKLDSAMKRSRPGSSGWNATPNTSISAPEIYEIYVRLLTSWMCRYCVCVCVWVAQSCPTLCDPMGHSPPGSSVHGILQARVLEWTAIPFSS